MVQVHYKGDWFKIIFHLLNLLLIGITEIAGSCPIGQKAYKESKIYYRYYGNNK